MAPTPGDGSPAWSHAGREARARSDGALGAREHLRVALPQFHSVILDVDSTLCNIEGIDWLAARRGPDVAHAIVRLTERAMDGEIPLEAVYGDRLALIRPTNNDIAHLARA